MSRPLRLDFPGALHYVTARGDRGEDIFRDDADRRCFLEVLGEVCARFGWEVHAYCLMDEHYHLLVETPNGNLWRGMRQLNGVYTQRFNRRHGLSGHVFQGRYKAVLAQRECYGLALARHAVLNPVRAGRAADPAEWPWSSHAAVLGEAPAPGWLDAEAVLGRFGPGRAAAVESYRRYVRAGAGAESPLLKVRHQVLLGDDAFVARLRRSQRRGDLAETAKAQRRCLVPSLAEYRERHPDRAEAMALAFLSGAYTMGEVGAFFGVHYMTVSRAVKRFQPGGAEEVLEPAAA